MTKVKNFAGFMKSRKVNEQENYGMNPSETAGEFGANPEAEETPETEETPEGEENTEDEPKEVTLEDVKAMVDDLTARVEKLEGGGEEGEEEGETGEEGEEGTEGETAPEGEEAPEAK